MTHQTIELSPLAHTWLLDLDGTLVVHNGYKQGKDEFLPGVLEFLNSIPENDMIIILTARELEARKPTEEFLKKHRVRYNKIIFNVPFGERILINDIKPSGLISAFCFNLERNAGITSNIFTINKSK